MKYRISGLFLYVVIVMYLGDKCLFLMNWDSDLAVFGGLMGLTFLGLITVVAIPFILTYHKEKHEKGTGADVSSHANN